MDGAVPQARLVPRDQVRGGLVHVVLGFPSVGRRIMEALSVFFVCVICSWDIFWTFIPCYAVVTLTTWASDSMLRA